MEGMPDKEKQEEKDGTKEGQPNQQLLTLTTESDYMVVTTPTTFKRDNRHVGQANEWREEMSPESALISNDVTPLMVDLVLENIFSYSNSMTQLKDLRLVCKTWNRQAGKTLRSKSVIDVTKLLSPYPEGLGWTDIGSGDYDYEAAVNSEPTPDHFESIKVIGNCTNLKEPKYIRWFEVAGPSVKRIRFISTLSCYHQTRFLEYILKVWCKNLKSLDLEGVGWYTNFYHYSRFDGKLNFICDLKELTVSGESEVDNGGDCEKELSRKYLNLHTRSGNKNYPGIEFEEIDPWLRILLSVGNQFNHQQADEFLANLDNNYKTDGGVFGQMMQNMKFERLSVKQFPVEHCDAVVLTMNRRPKDLVASLKEFQFGNFPLLLWDWQFAIIQSFKFPLAKLSLGPLSWTVAGEEIATFIGSFENTLQHLELSGFIDEDWLENEDEDFISLLIPELRKLKSFRNGNIFCTRLNGLDFLRRLPNLEKCSLTNAVYHSSIFPLDPTQVFNLLFQAANFEDQTHPLKELRLKDGNISYTRHIELLQQWFPHLTTVELTLSGTDVFVDFLRIMKSSSLEEVKLSIFVDDHEWPNCALSLNIPLMKKLRWLHLIHLPSHPLTIHKATFVEGFARAPELTSLKLENFAMFVDDVQLIRESLSKIFSVTFPRCVFMSKPVDFDISHSLVAALPIEASPVQSVIQSLHTPAKCKP